MLVYQRSMSMYIMLCVFLDNPFVLLVQLTCARDFSDASSICPSPRHKTVLSSSDGPSTRDHLTFKTSTMS